VAAPSDEAAEVALALAPTLAPASVKVLVRKLMLPQPPLQQHELITSKLLA